MEERPDPSLQPRSDRHLGDAGLPGYLAARNIPSFSAGSIGYSLLGPICAAQHLRICYPSSDS